MFKLLNWFHKPEPPHDLIENALALGSEYSRAELSQASAMKAIHDRIEMVAYQAFARKVSELEIRGDFITKSQSGEILSFIKQEAHKEMFKKGGYRGSPDVHLTPAQLSYLISQVGKIIHDRDTKLTDAEYPSISELLLGLDDHNAMVKAILLKSWYGAMTLEDQTHLDKIKKAVDFYPAMNAQLGFNLETTLKTRQLFWDTYFPGLRTISEDTSLFRSHSSRFINILQVRHFFGGEEWVKYDSKSTQLEFITPSLKPQRARLTRENLDERFIQVLNLSEEDQSALCDPKITFNEIRKSTTEKPPLISDRDLSMRNFLRRYFPEIMS